MQPSQIVQPAEAYDAAAPFYDAWSWQKFWWENEYPLVRDLVSPSSSRPSSAILDLGCGTGRYLHNLSRRFSRSVGVDISAGMLDVARSTRSAIEFLHGDMETLAFEDCSFDVVVSSRVMTHLADTSRAFREIARVMKPDGIAVVTMIDTPPSYGYTRLPTDHADVFTTTFRHSSEKIREAASSAGLARTKSFFIDVYSGAFQADRKPAFDENIVGSVAVFRQPDVLLD